MSSTAMLLSTEHDYYRSSNHELHRLWLKARYMYWMSHDIPLQLVPIAKDQPAVTRVSGPTYAH